MSTKIGIVLNYKKAERKKDELLLVNSRKRPWLRSAESSEIIRRKNKKYVPTDVSIGLYIKENFPDVTLDFIHPDDISLKRFKSNDVVFIVIYDLLEAFHLSGTKAFNKYKDVLKKSNNVYPPYEYQKFIFNKCTYYKYLEERKIPIAPTYCITGQKWLKRNPKKYTQKLIKKIQRNKWKEFIAKPVLGMEAIGFKKFNKCTNGGLECRHSQLKKYLKKVVPKYKAVALQEYIPGFDKENPEIRMYFINGKYKYSIITTTNTTTRPTQEGGTKKLKNYKYLLKFGKRVMKILPNLILNRKLSVPILTRIDIGTGLDGVPKGFFVNEVEFVPSLYIEEHPYPIDKWIAKAMVKTAKKYY